MLVTGPARGAWNMAVDEAMVEHIGRGESLPTLRLYSWQPACLSLGHAQPYADADLTRLQARGWDLVRRPTGGRAILHTDELTYSVTSAPGEPLMAGSVVESYGRLAPALLAAVRALGVEAEIKETPSVEPSSTNPVCFEVPSTNEVTAKGKKLIGSAQARRKEGILQHGSLPLTGDLARITEALKFEDEAARREAGQRLLRRATTVESVLGHAPSWEDACEAFVTAFQAVLGLRFDPCPLSQSENHRAEELVQEKYAHPSWMERV